MKCPSCSAEVPEGPECASCGVIFAKLKARAEKAASAPAAPAPAPAPSGLGSVLVLLGCLSAVVYGGYRFYEDRVSPPPPTEAQVPRIDSEAHKADVLAIEKAVYAGEGSVQAVAADAEAAANRIVESLLRRRGSRAAQDAAADVMEFSARMAGAQESLGASPTARLEFVRAWETLRAKRFAPADWFHPPEAVKPGEAPDFEKAAQRILNATMNLRALMAAAPGELAAFGEREVTLRRGDDERPRPAEDVPGQWDEMAKADRAEAAARADEDQKNLAAWRAWVPQWQARVDGTLADFPKPEEIPDELKDPYETLVRAGLAASNPPNPGAGVFLTASEPAAKALYLPSKHSRDAWHGNITAWLGELPDRVNGAREAKKGPKKG